MTWLSHLTLLTPLTDFSYSKEQIAVICSTHTYYIETTSSNCFIK